MLTSDIEVSIIIPNLHSPVIAEVLDAIRAQDYDLSKAEILVIGLDRYQLVREDRLIRFISTREPVSPAKARNLGASLSTGKILIFLDADCVPQSGWLAAMLGALRCWPAAGAISGAMLPGGDSFVTACGQISGFHEHLSLNHSGQRKMLASFSLLILRSIWDKVGGFDPGIRIAEDVDLSVRLQRGGYRLYLEVAAQVRHLPQRSRWRTMWQHAFVGGSCSIQVRRRHADWFNMPTWSTNPWAWRFLSIFIAIVRSIQIYLSIPGLWHYWRCWPWVVVSKLAWCWGAAAGLERSSVPALRSEE